MARIAAASPRTATPRRPASTCSGDGAEAKIAALGLKVRNGCTYHGLAVNVAWISRPSPTSIPAAIPGSP